MPRLVPSVAVLLLAACAAPAFAADYADTPSDQWEPFRAGYPSEPSNWAGLGDKDDPIKLEFGVRYWYSWGAQNFNSSGSNVTSSDNTHAGELHLRIEDHSTRTYAKALAGYSFLISGNYTGPSGPGVISDGHVGYVGADFGWNAFGDDNGSGVGPLVGYMFWQDSPNTGRNNYTTIDSGAVPYDTGTGHYVLPGASAPNDVNVHMLRLGMQGKANLGNMFDISAEVAAIPYAKVGGTVGADDPTFSTTPYAGPAQAPYSTEFGNISSMRASPTTIDGWGYGAAAEAWLGVHPTENMTFRVGGRAWYLQGTVDSTFDAVTITDPADSADVDPDFDLPPVASKSSFISVANPFSMFRYGLLAELTYAF